MSNSRCLPATQALISSRAYTRSRCKGATGIKMKSEHSNVFNICGMLDARTNHMWFFAYIIVLFLVLSSVVFAQQIDVTVKGTCKEFTVHVDANLTGCYDAKIEAPANVMHADGWKSSFFY